MSDPKTNLCVENWEYACSNCGQLPTVEIQTADGETFDVSELCGPCFFGEAAALDSDNW